MNKIYRHGDLLIYPIKKSEGKVVEHSGSFVLAEGETTGHKHVISAPQMEIRQDERGFYFVTLESEGTITHEEHKTIVVEPGIYRVGHEREKDWFSLTTRRVVD